MATAAHGEVCLALAVVAEQRDEPAVGIESWVHLVVDDGADLQRQLVVDHERAQLERLGLVRVPQHQAVVLVVERGALEVRGVPRPG